MGLLDKLREKREELIAAKKRRELLYQENGIYAFYERSMQLSYSTIGHVYLITPDEVLECDTPSNTSHKIACENLLSEKYHKNVELSDDYRDFGNQTVYGLGSYICITAYIIYQIICYVSKFVMNIQLHW